MPEERPESTKLVPAVVPTGSPLRKTRYPATPLPSAPSLAGFHSTSISCCDSAWPEIPPGVKGALGSAGATFTAPVAAGHNAFLYAYEGSATIGGKALPHRAAGLLSDGDSVSITAGPEGARCLLLAGKPLREPVVQYGPFVMNTSQQIEEAIYEYNMGTLALTADEIRTLEAERARRA